MYCDRMDPEAERNEEGNAGFDFGERGFSDCDLLHGTECRCSCGIASRDGAGFRNTDGDGSQAMALSEAAYSSTLAREFNMVGPEDALQWAIIYPQLDTYNFSQGDQVVDFAQRHGMKVRGHVGLAPTKSEMADGRKIHFERAYLDPRKTFQDRCGTLSGQDLLLADVVNEAFDELRPGELPSTIWRDQPEISLMGEARGSTAGRKFPETRCDLGRRRFVTRRATLTSSGASSGRTRQIRRGCFL
jgi:Glycosyl hydrolase family 10